MKDRSFPIKEALSIGWHKSWEHGWFLIGLCALNIGITIMATLLAIFLKTPLYKQIFGIANGLIIGPVITCGMLRIYYDIYTKNKSSYKQLLHSTRYLINYILATFYTLLLISIIITGAGVAAYATFFVMTNLQWTFDIITMTHLSVLFSIAASPFVFMIIANIIFYPLAIISNDAPGAYKALHLSKKISKGNRIKLLLFLLVSILLAVLSIGFLLGALGIAWVHVYFKLKALHGIK
jgi:hypothetical protein